ncbi:MAG: type II secretion system protein [Xanthomonadales bacterium]|nr:type II secretion system protein [Xanthomonadales bacterium]
MVAKMARLAISKKAQQGGFTLLEVLLAFLVFALSFAVTLEILSGAIRNTARARESTEAALIAQSLMDQVGLDIPLEAGGGATGEEGNYRWAVDIYLFDGGAENFRSVELADITGIELLEVECVVTWGEGGRERAQTFSTVRAISENAEDLGL